MAIVSLKSASIYLTYRTLQCLCKLSFSSCICCLSLSLSSHICFLFFPTHICCILSLYFSSGSLITHVCSIFLHIFVVYLYTFILSLHIVVSSCSSMNLSPLFVVYTYTYLTLVHINFQEDNIGVLEAQLPIHRGNSTTGSTPKQEKTQNQ